MHICLLLLPILSYSKAILYNCNLLHCPCNQLWPNLCLLSHIILAKAQPTLPSTNGFIWWHSNASLVTIIVGELHHIQIILPWPLNKINNTHFNMSSRIWIILSDWPFVYGWNVDNRLNVVRRLSCRLFQLWDWNLVSWSNIILVGTLCSLTTSCIYLRASAYIDSSTLNGIKFAEFVSLTII